MIRKPSPVGGEQGREEGERKGGDERNLIHPERRREGREIDRERDREEVAIIAEEK